MELIFYRSEAGYSANIDANGDYMSIMLDTGSPISMISIPSLLQITGESLFSFRKNAEMFLQKYKSLPFTVYGSQIYEVRYEFIPYLVKGIKIGEVKLPYFLFWVDITYMNSDKNAPTTILFGYDYIKQGKKSFDEYDNFHIFFDKFDVNTFSVEYAMSNVNDNINEIKTLLM